MCVLMRYIQDVINDVIIVRDASLIPSNNCSHTTATWQPTLMSPSHAHL